MASALSEAQREVARELIEEQAVDVDEVVGVIRKEVFQWQVEQLTKKVLDELDSRGIDTSRENVDMPRIAAESALNTLTGTDAGPEVAEIAVGGQADGEVRTNTAVMDTETNGPETYTVEVPIEGGEDPETIEVERVDPGTDPRLNSELNSMEIQRAFEEGVTPEMLRENRTNDSSAPNQEDETSPEDVPTGGLPWYQ